MTVETSLPIHNRMTIIKKLEMLMENKCSLEATVGRNERLLTSIVGINVEESTLMLAYGGSETLNRKMITQPQVEFNAVFRNIHASFTGVAIKKITYKGKTAFSMYIPGSLYWCNRRRHLRMQIPESNADACFCEIVLSVPTRDTHEEYRQNYEAVTNKIRTKLLKKMEAERKRASNEAGAQEILINLVRLKLHDISQSGCAILNHDEEYSYFLKPETVYENCKITTPSNSKITVSLKIVSKRNITLNDESDNADTLNELVGAQFLKVEHQEKCLD